MRKCITCGLEKELREYYKVKQNKDGYMGKCKSCHLKYASDRQKAKKDMVNEMNGKWRAKNRDKDRGYKRKYDLKHKAEKRARTAARRAKKKDQTPEMNKAERVEIDFLYEYHQIFNAVMPEKEWHVDHIEALANGGLHHPSNLQVLTAHDNLIKGARV